MPFEDICDQLSSKKQGDGKGLYPKDFKFVGWHPHCRCHVETILKTDEEMESDTQRILDGEPTSPESVNAVTDTSKEFKEFIRKFQAKNEERERDGRRPLQTPYFVKDNKGYYSQALGAERAEAEITSLDSQRIAKALHKVRTSEQKHSILDKWNRRRLERLGEDFDFEWSSKSLAWKDINHVGALIENGGTQEAINDAIANARRRMAILQRAKARHAARTADEIRRIQDLADLRAYGQDYVDAVHKMEVQLGMKRGKRMTIEQADRQNANPNWQPKEILSVTATGSIRTIKNPKFIKGYATNCQTCAPAYALRLMGFDVKAGCRTSKSLHSKLADGQSLFAWNDIKGNMAAYTDLYMWMKQKGYQEMSAHRYVEFWEEHTGTPGVYIITINWEKGGGHATILQRFKDGTLKYIEAQHDNLAQSATKEAAAKTLLNMASKGAIKPIGIRGIIRVDDKFFNLKKWAGVFVR